VFFGKTDGDFVTVLGTDGIVTNQLITVPDRDYALELGVELLADGTWGYVQAAVHRDVSSTHDGYEVYANYGYDFRRQRWLLSPSFGLSWKSGNLNDYYWGIREDEANVLFPAYVAGSGLNHHARLSASYQLNSNWALVLVAEYERLSSEAAASPIVSENHVVGAFAGFQYGF
jgi:outer membrane protein